MIRKSAAMLTVAAMVALAGAGTLDTLHETRRMAIRTVSADFAWSEIPAQGAFVKTELPYVPCDRASEVRVAHDGAKLHVRLAMREPHPEVLRGREKFGIWQNDVVEVMLQTPDLVSRKSFWHISVDCSGKLFVSEDHEIPEMPGSYANAERKDHGITARAEIGADGWCATLAIPCAVPSAPLKANFCRQTRAPYGFSSWSLTKAFQDMTRFGELVTDPAADNGAAYEKALAAFQVERTAVFGKFKERTYSWRWAFGQGGEGYRPLDVRYSAASGYGWRDAVETGETGADMKAPRYRKTPYSDLADRHVKGSAANVFRVDLPDGRYKVHLLAGCFVHERTPHRRDFTVTANGVKEIDFSVGNSQFCIWDFPVSVRGGKLELGFEPHEPKADPSVEGLARADEYLVKGFLVNSIVIYPAEDRKAAAKQIRTDELEIRVHHPTEMVNYDFVEPRDPDPKFAYSDAARVRGWATLIRPLGDNIYAGSRPRSAEEARDLLRVRAAPGEKFQISFGVVPLRDTDGAPWSVTGFPLRIREAMQMPYLLGGGRYGMIPYQLEEERFVDHDLDAGVTRNVWLTGTVPADAKPGVIRAAFAIGKDAIPVEIEVLPIRLETVEFNWGGYHPDGYCRPLCYEDIVARACAENGMNAFVFCLNPDRLRKGSYEKLRRRVELYQSVGIRGRYAVLCLIGDEDHLLRNKKIPELPQRILDEQVGMARKIAELGKLPGNPKFYYTAMDEAHCKGEPYWSEQIRLFRTIKENVPELMTFGSESERSYRRSAAYMDIPNLFEVPDFNRITGVKEIWSYPNQAMLKTGANNNAGRFCTGLLPSITPLKGILPWMVMHGHENSTFRADPWEMLVARGLGGFHVIPRIVTVLGEVGLADQRYFATLRKLIAEAKEGSSAQRKEAARQQAILDMVVEGTRPSYMYYYNNGHFPAETFCTLREKLVDGILRLQELRK